MHDTVPTTNPPSPARSLPEISEAAGRANCGVCWAEPGTPCGDARGDLAGLHLARFCRARRCGLITEAEMAAVLDAAGDVFTAATVILGGAR